MASKPVEAKKMAVGEKIEFDRILKSNVETKYGFVTTVKFIKDGKVTRTLFAGRGLLDFLDQNKNAKSVTLIEKVEDGEFTHNIYE